ncbi:Mitochondrial tRNAs modification protein [Coemansia sp. RSA 1813]|nr:Mitochondrial tRNAs modification protein [Coemansia sp. RSA 1646]KAJ1765322.1 Mitochondrial tRNAs modification protein [Coemansia sp. RSA 1843]KAJ2085639.1 Mitochondrial tRNAs modification protein [Coemansia sp. RSA 986]KAJ2210457.1 Mitochondrial tRNAs modification protein [Coemansia sp. RSA 487]KAJ2563067.1 Mitochondrial tRNAs modification protein [Coemansia sp. RSA 1813]
MLAASRLLTQHGSAGCRRALLVAWRRQMSTRPMRVLGIESSCDDTAAAVVSSDGRILGESTRHQYTVHEAHGGIVPGLAANEHLKHMPLVIRGALAAAGLGVGDLDAVAVTRGPGLPSSLAVCVAAGKALAAAHGVALVGVHHMEAHALMARMGAEDRVRFPFLCVLASGGHTLTLAVHAVNDYTLIGSTRDDSVGEAFDKVARELRVPWVVAQEGGGPGPALERLAGTGDPHRFAMPMPMDKHDTAKLLDFSFSGLKAHVRRLRETGSFDPDSSTDCADVAAAFQMTAARHLRKKTALAFAHARTALGVNATCLVVSGGVASNRTVRAQLQALADENRVPLVCPPPRLCTDNGVMIAWAGVERARRGLLDPYTIDFIQKWPLDRLKHMGYVPRSSSF